VESFGGFLSFFDATFERKSSGVDNFYGVKSLAHFVAEATFKVHVGMASDGNSARFVDAFNGFNGAITAGDKFLNV
jgi:hypothetical protein